jgi:pimeloyl-ACP methyl ester carboxylesterase
MNLKQPLLLLHGICSNANVFRPSVGPGLEKLLSPEFSVFLGTLTSGAIPPGRKGWDFDYHLFNDIPRIWQEACRSFGQQPAVLGYSMGGMLAAAAQALGLIDAPRLMFLGSPLDFPAIPFYPPIMNLVLAIAAKIGLRRIPIRLAARILLIVFGFQKRNSGKNDLQIFRVLARKAAVDVPTETLAQAVRWVNTRMFCDSSGKRNYLSELKSIKVPVIFVAGEADRIAPPRSLKVGYEIVSSVHRHFVLIPGATHFELIAGPHLYETAKIAISWFKAGMF